MWIYKEHGIWISVAPIPYSKSLTHWGWSYKSTEYESRAHSWSDKNDHMLPTKAYEAAINYTLEKLI